MNCPLSLHSGRFSWLMFFECRGFFQISGDASS
ncbi:hypothetical protein H206_06256 [Candidatus Electrothrix aarhusensis]|uniref:Uncharacterized protein n=1 Tax=Candidatus Electrothrix aarhusensis TaxID=1859131 RepID=A0A3S3UAS7_9BACT|nr:hypothetical protein H206_06256 [Candidatus Electrothrix aarhusensis]